MKKVFIGFAVLVVLIVAAAVSIPFWFDVNQFRPRIEAELSKALGREVKIGELKLSILEGDVSASGITIAEDSAFQKSTSGPFVSAKSLGIGVDMRQLVMERKLLIRGITIDAPEIQLIQTAAGQWNFSSIGGSKPAGAPPPASSSTSDLASTLSVQSVKISNGRVSLVRPGEKPLALGALKVEVKDVSPNNAIPFDLAANLETSPLALAGTIGPLNREDASLTPVKAKLKLSQVDVFKYGFVNASTPFRGIIGVDGSLETDGRNATVQGALRGERLVLAKRGSPAGRPVEIDFSVKHDRIKRSGVLEHAAISIGAAKANLAGSYQLSPLGDAAASTLHMKLQAPGMQLNELVAMLPALDVVLPNGSKLQGGTLALNLAFDGSADKLAYQGTIKAEKTRLVGFDLGSKMKTVASLAGIKLAPDTDITVAGAAVKGDPASTKIDNIEIAAAGIGELIGAGTISAANEMNFQMRANLHTGGAVLSMVGIRGDAGIPFKIQGTSSDPKFIPQIKDMAVERLKKLTPDDISRTVDKFKKGGAPSADEIGNTAGQILDLFRKKKQ